MRKCFSCARGHWQRGLTLMEAVVALGVIAVAVPLILSASAVTTRTRSNAEADTRSAWLAREVQRELTQAWRGLPTAMFPELPTFPVLATEEAPEILLFDQDGGYLGRGKDGDLQSGVPVGAAQYMVLLHALAMSPTNMTATSPDALSQVHVRVAHSARAPRAKRILYHYTILIPRQTAS